MRTILVSILIIFLFSQCQPEEKLRSEISLNGEWEIAKTDLGEAMPTLFNAKVAVPGLVDMAVPSLDSQDTLYENSLYWYKKKIKPSHTSVVRLKVNKAKYHTKVFLNGKLIGENPNNFTPSFIDLKPHIAKGIDEYDLVISIGCLNNLSDSVTTGSDFEKTKYIPGIYDDVKIIETGYPFIQNVQVSPNLKEKKLRIRAEIDNGSPKANTKMAYTIREVVSKKIVSTGVFNQSESANKENFFIADFEAAFSDLTLWTPENPFLYELELQTDGDKSITRFGMRTFETDKDRGIFLLNGEPYYLRGTNVCIFRFFEDPKRNGLPWDKNWATLLHSRFKEMNWNSIRYCIGFPPENWYKIADSLGILVQDEFPIWTGGKGGFEKLLKGVSPESLTHEYTDWMRERWNHPSVVIWDAQNESVNDITGKAIQNVRKLDLSNRPWDNGYAAPQSETDAIESHPYLFVKYYVGEKPSEKGALKDLLSTSINPDNDPNQHSPAVDGTKYQNPIIINEYAWLWLNRNGTPTTLTDLVYKVAFPEAKTKEQKYDAYARHMAILTEYWRAHRKAAAVMHFCGLGYSRPEIPRGQTSDNFIDLEKLTFEPSFYKYVKPAFSPIGLMLEVWDKSFSPHQEVNVPIHLVNDLDPSWQGKLELSIARNNEVISSKVSEALVDAYGKIIVTIPISMPGEKGNYELKAEIVYDGETISSRRQFNIQ